MEELQDYSGEFKPDLKLQDFSKDALVRLLKASAKLYVGIGGLYHRAIRERYGMDVALEFERKIWRRNEVLEVQRVNEAMNTEGNDVAALFKFCQLDPGIGGIMEIEYDLKNNNHGIMTVKYCQSLAYFERHGETDLQKFVCEVLDKEGFAEIARECFNPKMKARPLKLPPRKSKDEVACQWEFKIEE